MNKGSTCCTS